jgi:hypothetical protein
MGTKVFRLTYQGETPESPDVDPGYERRYSTAQQQDEVTAARGGARETVCVLPGRVRNRGVAHSAELSGLESPR